MSGRKSFILKFNYLFHPRGGVQNPDNRVNTRRLEKLIFAWCFPSLVTWRGDVLCGFPHVSAVSRTRSTVSLEVPAGEAKGCLDSILQTVVCSPGLTFVHWPSILPLITQWTKRQSSATLCFLFQKEMRFVSPRMCRSPPATTLVLYCLQKLHRAPVLRSLFMDWKYCWDSSWPVEWQGSPLDCRPRVWDKNAGYQRIRVQSNYTFEIKPWYKKRSS